MDYFRVEVPAGGATIFTTGDLNTIGTLENISAETLSVSDDDGDTMNFSFIHRDEQTIYVRVGSFEDSTGSYTIRADPLFTDDHGDKRLTATSLDLDTLVSATIDSGNDMDYFRVQAPASGVGIVTASTSVRLIVNLEDLLGVELADDGIGVLGFSLVRLDAGPFYVRVESAGNDIGSYTIRVNPLFTDDHGDHRLTATPLDFGIPVSAAINPGDDVDYFSVEAPKNGVGITVTGDPVTVVAILEDPSGIPLADEGDGGVLADFSLARLSAGLRYVRVESTGNSSESYTIRADPLFTDDHGNDRLTATPLDLSTSVSAVIDPGDDRDYFRVQVVDRRMPVRVYTTGTLNTVGTLEDSAGTQLAQNDNGQDSLNFSLDLIATGTYYVKVESFGNSTGSYTIQIELIAGDDHGDNILVATPLSINTSMSAILDPQDDFDYFRIEVPASGVVIFTTGNLDTFGRLEDPAGNQLASSDEGGDLLNFVVVHPDEGTLYVRVESAGNQTTGSYTIGANSLFTDDHGNFRISATPMDLLDVPLSGVIETPGDVDYFRVSADGIEIRVFTMGDLDTFGTATDFSGGGGVMVPGVSRGPIADDNSGEGENFSLTFGFSGVPPDMEENVYVKVESAGNHTTGSYTIKAVAAQCPPSEFRDPLYGCQWHLKNTGQDGHGTPGEDINVERVWEEGYEGEGVHVAVVDGGVYLRHRDLEDNASVRLSVDYTATPSGEQFIPSANHGTSVAGIIAARGDNGIGVRGVAPRATIYSYNAVLPEVTFGAILDAMTRNMEITAVSNNSWGSAVLGAFSDVPEIWKMAVKQGVERGFGGKGIVYVFSAGNAHDIVFAPGHPGFIIAHSNANLDEYTSYYAVITVCAVDSLGGQSRYSEWGANLWVCGPSSSESHFKFLGRGEITTTVRYHKYSRSISSGFGGTSAAAPMVSGVVALMREANPELTWRDVKLILAGSARQNDPDSNISTWRNNENPDGWVEGGLKYPSGPTRYMVNYAYGFGVVDAEAAVNLARGWINAPPMKETDTEIALPEIALPGQQFVPQVEGASTLSLSTDIDFTEFVAIDVTLSFNGNDGLEIQLFSPSGTTSRLTFLRDLHAFANYEKYTAQLGSARHLGEDPAGEWTLKMINQSRFHDAALHSWGLKVYGHTRVVGDSLIGLTITDESGSLASLVPAFSSDNLVYRGYVPYEHRSVVVTAMPEDSSANVVLSGTAADGSMLMVNGTTLSGLTPGEDTIVITVTSEDGMSSRTYTIKLAVIERVALEVTDRAGELTDAGGLKLLNGGSTSLMVRTTPSLSSADQEAVVSASSADTAVLTITDASVTLNENTATGQVTLTALGRGETTLTMAVTSTANVSVSTSVITINVVVDQPLQVEFLDRVLKVTAGEARDIGVRLTGEVVDDDYVRVSFDSGPDAELTVMPASTVLTGINRETTVTVTAGLAAIIGSSTINLVVDAMSAGIRVDVGDSLNTVVERRTITISVEPSSITLVRGGTATLAEVSTVVTVSAEPTLRASETVEVDLTAAGLSASSVTFSSATLNRDMQSDEVSVTAIADGPFAALATANMGVGTSVGNAVLEFGNALSVDVIRGVDAVFEVDGASTTLITRKAGEDIAIAVTTSPRLTQHERVALIWDVDNPAFSANGDARLMLSEEQPEQIVVVRSDVPGQTGILSVAEATGVEDSVRVATSKVIEIMAVATSRVQVLFRPSTLTLWVGHAGSTVTLEMSPRLGSGQRVAVTLDVGDIDGVEVVSVSGRPSEDTSRATVVLEQSTPVDTVTLAAAEDAEGQYEVSVEVSSVAVEVEPQPTLFVRVVEAILFRIRVLLEGAVQ